MIFQELILENFGPYLGKQFISLLPKSDAQPVILFGGMNGGGKTTLMDALRLALYGQRALCSSRGTLSYPDFLVQCVNRQANFASIQLSFLQTINNAPTPTVFRIYRTWTRTLKGGRDTLQIFENDQFKDDLPKDWDERIEGLLPLGISNLFLFDGEQVKELAEQDTLPRFAIAAMRSLLGLELPDRLSADLDILASRKRKEVASNQQLQELDQIETILDQQESDRRKLKKQLASIQTRLDKAEYLAQGAQEKFLSEGGKIAAEQTYLEAEKVRLETTTENHREELRDLAAGMLPLSLITPLLQQAQTQGEKELRYQQFEIAQELIEERTQHLLKFLQKIKLSSSHISKIEEYLTQENQELIPPQDELWLRAEAEAINAISNLITYALPNEQKLAQEGALVLEALLSSIESIERRLSTAAPPETHQKLTQAVQITQAELVRLTTDKQQTEREYEQAKQEIDRTKQKLLQFNQISMELQHNVHVLEEIDSVQKTLQLYKKRLKLQKLNQLESLVTECFRYLLNKSKLVNRIQIDTDTFSLSLYDGEGEAINKNRLSAGEKQLLAISLLWGLARASGRKLPVAIDTPLGRLDSKHRRNLIDRYFPQASHQVLILSTDTEIGEADVKRLRKEKVISHEYLLHYDPDEQHTEIQPGYFW